jgi:hypothetical protein
LECSIGFIVVLLKRAVEAVKVIKVVQVVMVVMVVQVVMVIKVILVVKAEMKLQIKIYIHSHQMNHCISL